MQPTELLNAEHRIILRMIDCLERFSEQGKTNGSLEAGIADQFVDFIREYSDKYHHAKEEDRLFPMLISCGLPSGHGPIPVMLQDHDNGRALTANMADSAKAAEGGDAQALEKFCGAAVGFADLLRGHIDKEDLVLYPMGDQAMSQADQDELAGSFDKVVTEGKAVREKYEAMAVAMGDKFGVKALTGDEPRNMPGCHSGPGCM